MGSSNPGCLKFLKRFNKKNQVPRNNHFFLYCIKKMNFWGSTKGAPHDRCRRTMKKIICCNEHQWNWVEFVEKWMNMFIRDLYSMYMILQGTGSLSCIRVYIIYVIPFGEQQPWMSEVPKTFQQKKQVPRNNQFLFILN